MAVKFTLFSFESIEALIKHYSEEESQLKTKLTYAPMKEYYQNKEKNGYTDYPEYHHSKRYCDDDNLSRIDEDEDSGDWVNVPDNRPCHPGITNLGKLKTRFQSIKPA